MATMIEYIIILGITAICIYILYRMIKKRQASTPGSASNTPAYSDVPTAAQTSQLQSIENLSVGSGVTTVVLDPTQDNSLRNFCVKSSFNSAYTGSYVNLDMVRYVISRGCRFLDFEIFIKDGVPIVAYSNATFDPSYTQFTSLAPAVSLDGVLSTIMANSFTSTAPNPGDPIFVQLHLNTYLQSGYSAIAQTIYATCSDKLYQGTVTPSTQLNDLMGKIVIIVDLATSPAYLSYQGCTGETGCLANLVNMESGSSDVRTYTQNQLTGQSITPIYVNSPTIYLMRIVLPDPGFFWGVQNSDAMYLIQNYGVQVVAQAFYVNDNKLAVYESFFRNFQSAFVPLGAATAYIQQQGP
jgi:hypothetical protein